MTLKIDRSFIGRMDSGGNDSEIVKTINTLANNLGMEVVAEGVETEGQLAQLKALRCRYGQGHLFSRALDATAAGLFVQNHQPLMFSTLVDDGVIVHSQLELLN
jgi:EAL domain-containing protein (putative c-di-GMP-specific phosphodiesterase class I)